MMIRLTTLIFLCMISFNLMAQKEDPAILDIRAKYAQIMKAKKTGQLTERWVSYDCPDYPQSGKVGLFYDSLDLRMIVHSYDDGSHAGWEIQYFIWDEALFFCYQSGGYWTFDGENAASDGSHPQTIDYNEEYRFYFSEGAPIRCLEKKYQNRSRDKRQITAAEVSNKHTDCSMALEAQLEWKKFLKLEQVNQWNEQSCWLELLDIND